jgi:general secretion pathway protein I
VKRELMHGPLELERLPFTIYDLPFTAVKTIHHSPFTIHEPRRGWRGFTLVEVLIALAIISIALMAALRAAGQGTASVGELRSRLLAGWTAENLLAEQRALGIWLPLGVQHGTALQGGLGFSWREEVISTPHPAFRRVDIQVYAGPEESRPLARLTGFVVQPR